MKEKLVLITFALVLAFGLVRFDKHLDRLIVVKAVVSAAHNEYEDRRAAGALIKAYRFEELSYLRKGR